MSVLPFLVESSDYNMWIAVLLIVDTPGPYVAKSLPGYPSFVVQKVGEDEYNKYN